MPTAVSASRTSSSLNGLMIAITIFMNPCPMLMRKSSAVQCLCRVLRGGLMEGNQASCQLRYALANMLADIGLSQVIRRARTRRHRRKGQ
jgi:hypothetical protein